ncbi:hypothetical protein PsorP6_014266 [Peronosclerospora sorghi]|uniref:Uncharacterized protein n=1 Tax=Peronosclerospora sorghi TaxID=230839 RepID=A0ACC0VJ30_9STRA|nr:hypothetical protein PsorP6_014266 [Peronosclerospora sorghi]
MHDLEPMGTSTSTEDAEPGANNNEMIILKGHLEPRLRKAVPAKLARPKMILNREKRFEIQKEAFDYLTDLFNNTFSFGIAKCRDNKHKTKDKTPAVFDCGCCRGCHNPSQLDENNRHRDKPSFLNNCPFKCSVGKSPEEGFWFIQVYNCLHNHRREDDVRTLASVRRNIPSEKTECLQDLIKSGICGTKAIRNLKRANPDTKVTIQDFTIPKRTFDTSN